MAYAFIHGDWRRLLGNGLFFSVFALALENDLGVVRFADLAILTPAHPSTQSDLPSNLLARPEKKNFAGQQVYW